MMYACENIAVTVTLDVDCKDYLAKSLFVFQLGENDYNLQLNNGFTVDEASKNMPIIVNTITSGVEVTTKLYIYVILESDNTPIC